MTDAKQSPGQLEELKKVSIQRNINHESRVHLNLRQDVIMTTEDKVRLCLYSHADKLAKQKTWSTPVALLVSITLALLTAEFKDFLTIPKETWQAFFLLGGLATILWSGVAIYKAAKTTTSIDQIIEEIKKTSEN